MWILILPTLIWFSQCIDNKIWVGAFQLGGHLKQQKMDTSCFWKFTKIPKNDQFSCLPNHCKLKKKKPIPFVIQFKFDKLSFIFKVWDVSVFCFSTPQHLFERSSEWNFKDFWLKTGVNSDLPSLYVSFFPSFFLSFFLSPFLETANFCES